MNWRALLFLLLLPVVAWGQGLSLITEYDSETYNNWRQNWAITQDSSQYMLFGNGTGIMRFDGTDWKSIHLPKNGIVRSFKRWNNSIYVGGEGEFGVLKSDSFYNIRFVDFTHDIIDHAPSFSAIWSIQDHNGKLLFGAREGLFEMKGRTLRHQFGEAGLGGYIFKWGDKNMVQVDQAGLATIGEQGLDQIEGSEIYIGDRLYVVLPLLGGNLLISRKNGFMLHNGKTFQPYYTEAKAYVDTHKIYRGIYINEHQIALATLSGGIVIINVRGEIVDIITEEDGLPTNIIYGLYVDHEKTLWAATDKGLAKILANNPATRYDGRLNFTGIPVFMEWQNNKMYVGSTEGIFVIEEGKKVVGLSAEITRAYGGFAKDDVIWMNTPEGIYRIRDGKLAKLTSDHFRHFIPTDRENVFYGANGNEIQKLVIKNNVKLVASAAFNVPFPIRYLAFINKELWVLPGIGPMYNYTEKGELLKKYSLAGDTTLDHEWVKKVDGTIYAGSVEGLYEYETGSDEFAPATLTADDELTGKQVNIFKKCGNFYWFRNNRKIKRLNRAIEPAELLVDPYNVIDDGKTITTIACGKNGAMWFGGSSGVYHLEDPDWSYKSSFNTNITGVLVGGDSLIYGGYGEPQQSPELSYWNNSLRFTYSAASYIAPEFNKYRVRLRGYDENWSNWSDEGIKDYTFIREGTYRFEVQSKNIYNKMGTVDSYIFTILPPWYRTWWAYTGYLILAIGMMYWGYRIRLNQILKEYRIRNHIADDLHDEISATLTSISFFAEAAAHRSGEKRKNYIDLIYHSAVEAKEKITDIVWAINPEHDDWANFLAKCRRYASDMFESRDMKYDIKIDKPPRGQMSMRLRQHLWLIFKEVVTNTTRHSEASLVKIEFNFGSRILKMKIQDDGRGFDSEIMAEGNGVGSIKQRAKVLNGTAILKSKSQLGTLWIIDIPLE